MTDFALLMLVIGVWFCALKLETIARALMDLRYELKKRAQESVD